MIHCRGNEDLTDISFSMVLFIVPLGFASLIEERWDQAIAISSISGPETALALSAFQHILPVTVHLLGSFSLWLWWRIVIVSLNA